MEQDRSSVLKPSMQEVKVTAFCPVWPLLGMGSRFHLQIPEGKAETYHVTSVALPWESLAHFPGTRPFH